MHFEYTDKKLGSIFGLSDHLQRDKHFFSVQSSLVKILWNRNDHPVPISIDDLQLVLEPNQMMTTTFLQKVSYPEKDMPLTALLFNREFYCLIDHDSEVSCNGILFFGTQDIPIIELSAEYKRKFDLLIEVVLDEFKTVDNIQGDMLQMLLKRWIILCTRLAKEQLNTKSFENSQIETIRKFNFLVDMHYKDKRKVKDYAELLFKSPKTLSNLFATYNQKSPQQIIHERIALEAKRMILFTDFQTQEIAYELGFEDPAYFSRFFKKVTTMSPSDFKTTYQSQV